MFKFVDYDLPELIQRNLPDGRLYETPDGKLYPSVTTVLGSVPNPHLEQWTAAVGKETAEKISGAAARRGTLIHEAVEDYLRGRPCKISKYLQTERKMYEALIPHLNAFEEIHALEKRVYSDKLKVAGTIDCIAKIAGNFYLIDFKTSGRFKSASDIHSYFMQCAVYSLCWYERTGVLIDRLKILMTTEDDGVLVFDEMVKPWIAPFIEIRKNF